MTTAIKNLTDKGVDILRRFMESPEGRGLRIQQENEDLAERRALLTRADALTCEEITLNDANALQIAALRRDVAKAEEAISAARQALYVQLTVVSAKTLALSQERDRLLFRVRQTAPAAIDEFHAELSALIADVPAVDVRTARHWLTQRPHSWSNEESRSCRVEAILKAQREVEAMRYDVRPVADLTARFRELVAALPGVQSVDSEHERFGGNISGSPNGER
jgi:hypothetical protein